MEGSWFVGILTPVKANTNYYVSATRKNLSGGNRTGNISVYGGYNTDMVADFQNNNGTFNSGNRTSVYLVFYADSGTAGNYADFENIQLEKGTTSTDYEPYVGGTASPNPDYPQDVKVVTGEQTVKVTGKNLCDGINQDYWLTSTAANAGVATGNSGLIMSVQPNTTYTISTTASQARYRVALSDQTYSGSQFATYDGVVKDGTSQSITINSSTHPYLIVNATDLSKIQVEKGSTATIYEPYQSQNYELNLGKNLLEIESSQQGGVAVTLNADGSVTCVGTTGNNAYYNFMPYQQALPQMLPAGTYTFSRSGNSSQTRIRLWDSSKTNYEEFYISPSATYVTVTTTFDCYYVNGYVSGLSANTQINETLKLQLERGSTATTFAAYKTPLELCKIGTYQDYIYKSGGNWYVSRQIGKVTFDGTVTPDTVNTDMSNTTRVGWNSYATIFKAAHPDTDGIYSNYFLHDNNWNYDRVGIAYANNNGGVWFRANKTTIGTTSGEVVTWLTNHPVDLYFIKLTATQEQITDTDLISQLEALANANSYRGTTHIDTASDGYNLPVIISATATGNMDGTVTNSGNTYSRPKLTIYGTGTIGIYLDGNQMFSVDMGDNYHITIDTNAMNAYKDTTDNLKNRLVTGDYSQFKLAPGANSITFTGNSTKCIVENYTRWI